MRAIAAGRYRADSVRVDGAPREEDVARWRPLSPNAPAVRSSPLPSSRVQQRTCPAWARRMSARRSRLWPRALLRRSRMSFALVSASLEHALDVAIARRSWPQRWPMQRWQGRRRSVRGSRRCILPHRSGDRRRRRSGSLRSRRPWPRRRRPSRSCPHRSRRRRLPRSGGPRIGPPRRSDPEGTSRPCMRRRMRRLDRSCRRRSSRSRIQSRRTHRS